MKVATKVAVITGGNRGVGKSTALNVAKRGVGVILTYRGHEEEANAVVREIEKEGGRAAALKLDINDFKAFGSFSAEVKRVLQTKWQRSDFDYLVNNAGVAQRTLIKDTTPEEFDELMQVHVKGPFFLTQKLVPMMAPGGHIITISSGLTRMTYPGGVALYAAAKGAVEVLTRYMASEFASLKIRANCIAPGALDTDFGGGRTDAQRKAIGEHILAGRMGAADDIGPVIAAVLSSDFEWVNGQRIEASGGQGL